MRALAACALASLLVAGTARADAPARGELSWDASMVALGCPSRDVVEAATSAQLGRDVFAGTARVEFVVVAAAGRTADGGVRVVITLMRADGSPLGERTLETPEPTCAPIADGLRVVLAIMADLGAQSAPVHPRAPRAASRARPPTWPGGSVMLGLAGDVGLLPAPDLAARVRVELTPFRPLSVALTLHGAAALTAYSSDPRTRASVDATAWLVGLDVMPRIVDLASIDVALGGGVEAGAAVGRGGDVAEVRTAMLAVLALTGGGRVAVGLGGPFQLALDVRVGVSLLEPTRFSVQTDAGRVPIAQSERVFGRMELSFGVRIR